MLVNMKALMEDAEKYDYCVGMFTSPSLPFAEAVIAAAEETNTPVMFGQVEQWDRYGDITKKRTNHGRDGKKSKSSCMSPLRPWNNSSIYYEGY